MSRPPRQRDIHHPSCSSLKEGGGPCDCGASWEVKSKRPAFALIVRDDLVDLFEELPGHCKSARVAVGTTVSIFVWLATYANRDGTNAYPMQRRCADETGFSRSTVKRSLRALRSSDWLSATWRPFGGGKRRVYELHFRARI